MQDTTRNSRITDLVARQKAIEAEYLAQKSLLKSQIVAIAEPYVEALLKDMEEREREREEYGIYDEEDEDEDVHGRVEGVSISGDVALISLRAQGCSCCGDDFYTIEAPAHLLDAGQEAITEHFALLKGERIRKREEDKVKQAKEDRERKIELYQTLKKELEIMDKGGNDEQ